MIDMTRYNAKFASIVDKMQDLGSDIESTPRTLTAIDNGLDSITSGGDNNGNDISTQSQSIFTGWTAPLTYQGTTENEFIYESPTHNITISGLGDISTISGNGTKKVTVTIDTSATSDRRTPFTITCVNDTETLVYNGIAFHYGAVLASGNCLAVAQTISGTPKQVDYIFIESSSLPLFTSETTLWNTIYSYQITSFIFGKWAVTSIGDYFLYNCYSFNQPLTIPSGVTSIGDDFLYSCHSFNQPLTIPSGVNSIGNNFMRQCYSFNQPLDISGVNSIGDNFLYNCYSFNQPLTIPSGVTSIGDYFMYQCRSFNQPLTIPSGVTSIGTYFMYQCYSFNQPLDISGVTSIGDYFLSSCYSFNQPLDISGVTSIGNNFLSSCYSFNQPLTIPSGVTSIGNNFMRQCYSFNQPLDISGVTSIGTYFLSSCYSFNQPLDISGVTSIGTYFMYQCRSFNQPLTIPSGVTSIGNNFLRDCYSLSIITYNSSVFPTDNNSLSQSQNSKTSASGTGILVTGTNAAGLKAALLDRTTSPYRKLVLA